MSCVRAVRTALEKVDGVAKVDINFSAKKATVTIDPKKTDGGSLTKALPKKFTGQVIN